jgi:GTP pyrophosphokinase
MEDEAAQDATDLRFVIAVRDSKQLETALGNLRRTHAVLKAQRSRVTQ